MSKSLSDVMKERYRFDEWARAGAEGEQLFVRNFRVSGDELPNELVASRVARLGAARRLNTSTWESLATAGGRPVIVDVFEYPSREEAREALLELTAQFHRPVALDVKTGDVGDVRIMTPDGAWFAFARGNLVVRVVSGNGLTTPAREVAQQIDDSMMEKPAAETVAEVEPPQRIVAARAFARAFARTLARAAAGRGERAVAGEPPGDERELPEEEEPFIKVFSKGATVNAAGDLVIVPEAPEVEVEVFEAEPGGQWSVRRYQTSPPEGPATPQPDE